LDLMTGLSAIQQTLAITKELRGIDDKVAVAEFKIRISEIVDKLLDAKTALVDAQEREIELRKQVQVLQQAALERGRFKDEGGLLFELDERGTKIGEPYCNLCFVREDKKYRLKFYPASPAISSGGYYSPPDREHYYCPNCKEGIYN
jgi:hypothetical protein